MLFFLKRSWKSKCTRFFKYYHPCFCVSLFLKFDLHTLTHTDGSCLHTHSHTLTHTHRNTCMCGNFIIKNRGVIKGWDMINKTIFFSSLSLSITLFFSLSPSLHLQFYSHISLFFLTHPHTRTHLRGYLRGPQGVDKRCENGNWKGRGGCGNREIRGLDVIRMGLFEVLIRDQGCITVLLKIWVFSSI